MKSILWWILLAVPQFLSIGAEMKTAQAPSISSFHDQENFYPSPEEEDTNGFQPSRNLSLYNKWKNIRKKERPKLMNLAKSISTVRDIFRPFPSEEERREHLRSQRKKHLRNLRTNFKVVQIPPEGHQIKSESSVYRNILHLSGRHNKDISIPVTPPPIHMFPPPLIPIRIPPKRENENFVNPVKQILSPTFIRSNITLNKGNSSIRDSSRNSFRGESYSFPISKLQKQEDPTLTRFASGHSNLESIFQDRETKKLIKNKDLLKFPGYFRGEQRKTKRFQRIPSRIRPKPVKSKPQTREKKLSSLSNLRPIVNDKKTPLSEILGNKFHSGIQQRSETQPKEIRIKPTTTSFKIIKLQNLYNNEESLKVQALRDRPSGMKSSFKKTFDESEVPKDLQHIKDELLRHPKFSPPNFTNSDFSPPIHHPDSFNSPENSQILKMPLTTFVSRPTFSDFMVKPSRRPLKVQTPPLSLSPFQPRPRRPPSVKNIPTRIPSNSIQLQFPNTVTDLGNFVHSQTLPIKHNLISQKLKNTISSDGHPSFSIHENTDLVRIKSHSGPSLKSPLNTLPLSDASRDSVLRPHSWSHISFNPKPTSFSPSSIQKENIEASVSGTFPQKLHSEPPLAELPLVPSNSSPPSLQHLSNGQNQPGSVHSLSHSSSTHFAVPENSPNTPSSIRGRIPNRIRNVPLAGKKTRYSLNNSKRKRPTSLQTTSASSTNLGTRGKAFQPDVKPASKTISDQQLAPSKKMETEKSYEYNYVVDDPSSGLEYGHKERRDGSSATGEYFVTLADGRTQHVTYVADENGYRADVKFYDSKTHST